MGNAISISLSVDQLFSRCWDCSTEPASRIRKFQDSLNNLKTRLEELQALRNDVMRRVDAAKRQGGLPLDTVQLWFSRVLSMETQVKELITKCETDRGKNKWSFKYKTGKEVASKLDGLDALKESGSQFDKVAEENTCPPWVEPRPVVPTVGLQPTFDSVWKLLTEDDETGIIGIYGMGGVGKTTLMNLINQEFLKGRDQFEHVIWVVVSKDARMEKIQEDIGKKIGCYNDRWEGKLNTDEKAAAIFRILREKRFVMLLDDIWERIELGKLGVPFPDKDNMSKVVFTSRSEVMCGKMEAYKIKVECLPWKHAWELFERKVGKDVLNIHFDILEIAKDVAKECKGLPLALITIGRAMACMQTPQEWRYALESLRKSSAEFSGMEEEVFSILRFSYDNLPDEKIKECFLYIALFPEDFKIKHIELIEYWIGEGFLDGYDSTEEAHCHGYYIIGTLLHTCLLEYGDPLNRSAVKMHDVVRDMALWISSENGNAKHKYIVRTQITRAPEVGKWSSVTRISLMQNDIRKLIEAPNCPNLSTLLIRWNYRLDVSPGFFEFMPNLTVLDLSCNRLYRFPLTITKLVSLRYLNLSRNLLVEIPLELGNLVKLKYLNLSQTEVEFIKDEVISGLTSLQILKFISPRLLGEYDRCVEKLERLKCLDYLEIQVDGIYEFQRLMVSKKLLNCTRILWIIRCRLKLDISSVTDMKNLNELVIWFSDELQDITADSIMREAEGSKACPNNNIIINQVCFRSLAIVKIHDCPNLRDVTWLILAPNLRFLGIHQCDRMEEVIFREKWQQFVGVEENPNLFGKLQILELGTLPNLKSICWEASSFPLLKAIEVYRCEQLKKLPLNSNSASRGKLLVIKGEQSWWDNLDWEDDGTRNTFLNCFHQLTERVDFWKG